MPLLAPALLALADGTVFRGSSIGAAGQSVGEVVFNTATTGYQEILTDPSYCRQIVTLTSPHIGNTGANTEDEEGDAVHAAGLVIRDASLVCSSWRATSSLPDYLVAHNVIAIAGIDTRKLTRVLREHGAQGGCIVAADAPADRIDADQVVARARAFPGLAGMDLAKVVSTAAPYAWTAGSWHHVEDQHENLPPRYHVVALDYGIKRNILRMLVDRGCRVTVMPAQSSAKAVLATKPDGVFLSNGPGDPEPCDYAIRAIRSILDETSLPVFGICLGHQLMALASGARTMKMKFGHHGANHPVKDLDSGRVVITSQNHGFAVDPASLTANLRITHQSLFDRSIQGLERTDRAAFCFQGHPEASPGPHDSSYLFDRFVALMAAPSAGEIDAQAR